MNNKTHDTRLKKAISYLLVPVIRLFYHFGVDFNEFSDIAKRTYVHVATNYPIGINGKPTAVAISEIAGIPRREVSRLQKLNVEDPQYYEIPLSIGSKVFSAWLRNEKYLNDKQQPLTLALSGQAISFASLVKEYGEGHSYDQVLTELTSLGVAEIIDYERIKLINTDCIPIANEVEKFVIICRYGANLLNAGRHNIVHDKETPFFQKGVTFEDVPLDVLEEFKTFSGERSMDLLLEYNRWFYEKMKSRRVDGLSKKARLGVGIFYFDNVKYKD